MTLAQLERELRTLSNSSWYNSRQLPDTTAPASDAVTASRYRQELVCETWAGLSATIGLIADRVKTLKNQAIE